MLSFIKETMNRIEETLSQETPKKYGLVFLFILAAMIICELFVFNFKWINSAFDKEIIAEAVLSGFTETADNTYRVTSDSAVIEFKDINEDLKYLYFSPGSDTGNEAEIVICATDEANEAYLSAPARTVLSDVKRSQYIRLHFSGNVENLRITVSGLNGRTIDSPFVKLNVHVPLMFSWLRLIILTLLGMLAYVLRPKSSVYTHKTDLSVSWQKYCAEALLIVQAAAFWTMMHWNTDALSWHKTYEHHQQYYSLVEAFKDGHLYISDNVSENLRKMENPYDTHSRDIHKATFKWDHAYYNGKYYCYFGAAPAVLIYLPYNLITGQNLPNYVALFIIGVMTMAGIMLLLWEVIKKWYRGTPFAVYLLLSVVFSAASGIAYAIYKPDFYMVPGLMALMFSAFGLSFWLSAERKNKKGNEVLVPWRLAAGAVCVAMTALCRPQFLLTAVFGVMLFWNHAFKKRTLFSKNTIRQTAAICLPFVIIGAVTMLYNAARFGSPFDFGANYNLTTNDMTHRGLVFGRTGLGIFTYFLQPINFDAVFPFLHDFSVSTTYQGLTLTEKLIGGVLMLYPILLTGIWGCTQKSLFANKRPYRMVYISVIIAVFLAIMDAQMAGLLTRYFTDFVWLVMLASCVTIFALYEKYDANNSARRHITGMTLILSSLTLVLAFLSILARSENSIQSANPTLYHTIEHLIAFWM